jgi:cyclophilin family peptidyl-prolyl cis-trans isomerase
MRRWSRAGVVLMALAVWAGLQGAALAQAPAPGPTGGIETSTGTITIETYPSEAPKTVANFLGLVKSTFYNRQHFHRAESFVIQVGDPSSKDLAKKDVWGRRGNGEPLGVAEISKKLTHKKGAVGMAHAGDATKADSQFYIKARRFPKANVIFGQVTSGMDVVDKIEVGDTVKRMYIK